MPLDHFPGKGILFSEKDFLQEIFPGVTERAFPASLTHKKYSVLGIISHKDILSNWSVRDKQDFSNTRSSIWMLAVAQILINKRSLRKISMQCECSRICGNILNSEARALLF